MDPPKFIVFEHQVKLVADLQVCDLVAIEQMVLGWLSEMGTHAEVG